MLVFNVLPLHFIKKFGYIVKMAFFSYFKHVRQINPTVSFKVIS